MKNRKMLSFHFGNLLQTNDSNEVHFFEEYVYKNKGGRKLKEQIDEIKSNVGNPFILSLVHHVKDPSCEIPMWKMYGQNFCGVRLKFNYTKLKDYYKNIQDTDLIKCQYYYRTQMEERGKAIRKSNKDGLTSIGLESTYKESVVYKTYSWIYENEWRVITWVKDQTQVDFVRETGRLYLKQEIPLDILDMIEIGPKADQVALYDCLSLIKEKLGPIKENHFKIEKSKLQIGYI